MAHINYRQAYSAFLKRFLTPARSVYVVFDCSNGTTGLVLKALFPRKVTKNVRAVFINDIPDGRFPAHGPNPMKKGALQELRREVVRRKADLGVIFDADGDRVFFVDSRGRQVEPDAVAVLISKNYRGPVLVDIRSGYLAREMIAADGKRVIDSRVGHTFIKETMRRKKIPFAAELSGHYYFKDFFYADSGIFAALQVINEVARMDTLVEWLDTLPRFYRSGELNFAVADKEKKMRAVERAYAKRANRISRLDGIKMFFDDFWVSVRPSNTENVLRLNVEARAKAALARELRALKALLTKEGKE